MDWLLLLIIAYFFISLTALTDKFLLNNILGEPVVYAFLVSALGLVAVLLAPFGLIWPGYWQLLISLIAGFSFTFALFFLYKSLKIGETSRVFTTVGSLGAVLTFTFSAIFLKEILNSSEIFGFVFLIIGGILISLDFQAKRKFNKSYLIFSLLAALMFAISYTSAKHIYTVQGFISGFVWLRIFAFIAGLLFLVSRKNFQLVKKELQKGSLISKKSNQFILIGGQASSAVGFLILNYVISLKNPAIVLAGQGLQYAFLFIFTLAISNFFPKILKEEITALIILQKGLAIVLISIGLVVVAF